MADTKDSEPALSSTTTTAEDNEKRDIHSSDSEDKFEPGDPNNPRNWSALSKYAQIIAVAFLNLLSPLGSTIIAPGAGDVLRYFHNNNETVGSFITSIYLLGYVFGPLVSAPLSEVYGRLPVYLVSSFFFLVFNICCAVSPNIAALLIFRFLAGTFSATAITMGPASIADMFSKESRGLPFAVYALGSLVGPVAGPVAGGFLVQAKGWRWVFWVLSILSGAALVYAVLALRETLPNAILRREAKKDGSKYQIPEDAEKRDVKSLFWGMSRPLRMMVLYPVTTALVLYSACLYGWLYLLFTTYPTVFQEQYGFSNAISGLVYLGIGVGTILGVIVSGAISDRWYKALGERKGRHQPEHRLPLLIFGGFFIPASFFWYGWSAYAKTQWIVPIIGTGLLGFGFGPVFLATSSYLVEAFPQFSASANAVATIVRSLFGALLPLAGPSLFGSLGLGWGNSLLAFLTIGMLPISLVLYKYGEKFRRFKLYNREL